MDLFDEEFDELATRKNVRKFLKKTFPRLIMLSKISSTQLQSPTLSDMPTSKPVGNVNEKKIINMLEAQRLVKEVINIIKCCRGHGSTILFDVYVLNIADWKTANKIGYSEARYQDLKNQSLLDFADGFMFEKDFHVYK